MGAVDSLRERGWLPEDIAAGLKGHNGRVVPMLYGLLRNELFKANGINRMVPNAGDPGGVTGPSGGVVVPFGAAAVE